VSPIDVEDVIIPDCGHWITEEQPQATTDLIVDFLHRRLIRIYTDNQGDKYDTLENNRTALIAVLLLTVFHTERPRRRTPLKGLETLSLFTVRGPMDQVGPEVIPLLQARIACGRRQNPLTFCWRPTLRIQARHRHRRWT